MLHYVKKLYFLYNSTNRSSLLQRWTTANNILWQELLIEKRKSMTISTKQKCLDRQKVSMNYMKNCLCNYFIILLLASNKHRIFLLEVQHLFKGGALI